MIIGFGSFFRMEKVVVSSQPLIAAGAKIPHPVLTLKELQQNTHDIQPNGGWRKGFLGHQTLPLYFNDGATGPSRPILVQIKGVSQFGLGFYEGGEENKPEKQEKPDDSKKKKKPRTKPASIALKFDESPEVQVLDLLINAAVKAIMEDKLAVLKQILAPEEDEVICVQRKVARASSGSTIKNLRAICYPGKTQLELGGQLVSMKDFPKDEGSYGMVLEIPSIDASYEKGVITYGPVIYGRSIRLVKQVEKKPLEWREETDGDQETTWTALSSEDDLAEQIRRVNKIKEKLKKGKEKKDRDEARRRIKKEKEEAVGKKRKTAPEEDDTNDK